jgi:hypothetical protein
MVSRYLIHEAMIKIIKEVLVILSDTSKLVSTHDATEQTLTKIQQGIRDLAAYVGKLYEVSAKDSAVEKEYEQQFEKLDGVVKAIEQHVQGKIVEPRLQNELDRMDDEIKNAELEEYEEIKSDWRIDTHLKEVIDKLDVYKKGYLQFYATKRDEIAVLLREIALHMTACLKLLDLDIREDKQILEHLRHTHELVKDATQTPFSDIWQKTGQEQYIKEVISLIDRQIADEAAERKQQDT